MNYPNARIGIIVAVLLAGVALSGCSQPGAASGAATIPPQVGAEGSWELANPGQVTSESTSIDILITRSGCASGKTGEILEPVVSMGVDDIIIRTDVVPSGAGDCPPNDHVAATVVLPEPIGNRSLLDALFLIGKSVGHAENFTAVRWAP